MSTSRWFPPQDVLAAGESARVGYRLGSIVQEGESTQKSIPNSLHALRDWVVARHPEVSSGGMRRSPEKPNTPGRRRDPHEEGIAIDFMTHNGDSLANWLVSHAQEIGIQYVLWNKYEWSASHLGPRWENYTGAESHDDHVHMELSPEGISKTGAAMLQILNGIAGSAYPQPPQQQNDITYTNESEHSSQSSSAGIVPAVAIGAAVFAAWWMWKKED